MKSVYGLFFHREESCYKEESSIDSLLEFGVYEDPFCPKSENFYADDLIMLFATKALAEAYALRNMIELDSYTDEGYYCIKKLELVDSEKELW